MSIVSDKRNVKNVSAYHEHNGGICNELNANGKALALLHAEPAVPGQTDQGALEGCQLHQLHHLNGAAYIVLSYWLDSTLLNAWHYQWSSD